MRRTIIGASIIGVSAIALVACGAKANEPFQDAPINSRNMAPAIVGNMPDGFSNWAAKCDGPNMVYVLFHSDGAYGSFNVVPNDPRCKG